MAQLVERSPQTPEICSSNPIIDKLLSNICLRSTALKRQNKEKRTKKNNSNANDNGLMGLLTNKKPRFHSFILNIGDRILLFWKKQVCQSNDWDQILMLQLKDCIMEASSCLWGRSSNKVGFGILKFFKNTLGYFKSGTYVRHLALNDE